MSAASLAGASDTAEATPIAPVPLRIGARGLVVAATLVAVADWLLYDHEPGIALVVFMLVLAAGAVVANPLRAGRGGIVLAACILIAALAPFAVNPSPLSFLFAVAGIALFAALLFADPGPAIADALAAARSLPLRCLWSAPVDIVGAVLGAAGRRPQSLTAALVVWFVPVTLGAIFALLFVNANPLIAGWVSAIDLTALAHWLREHLDPPRISFWLLTTMLVWPLVFMRRHRRRPPRERIEVSVDAPEPAIVGQAAILRSLIVFNALFALQTVLDAMYLWGGVALPDGMTYAEYAHRGAYPLIVTALLAAAFVVVALQPGSATERAPLIRALVFLFIAQNVWLVVSSILRLDLYVAAYSLTYWRIAAFIWMLLVAIGLLLILARIAGGRSNRWLIGANLVSLTLTLYASALPSFAGIIARYNVVHSAEMGGGGPALDRAYLRVLGREAIPAVDALARKDANATVLNSWWGEQSYAAWRHDQETALRGKLHDWRSWNVSDWQLMRYLDAAPSPSPDAASR